jgi:hypothetical protein
LAAPAVTVSISASVIRVAAAVETLTCFASFAVAMLQEAAITASANKDFFMEDRSPISGKTIPPHLRYVNRCEFEFEIVSVNRVNE